MEPQREQGCMDWLEPRFWGVHALMTRLLGQCTCQSEARVMELYTVDGSVRDGLQVETHPALQRIA